MSEIKDGSKEDINQRFQNNIEFLRYEFNSKLHMIVDDEKRTLLRDKWLQNKHMNPLTGRKIKKNSETYRKLARLTGLVIKASDLGSDRFVVT
jgi:hypothetical protein